MQQFASIPPVPTIVDWTLISERAFFKNPAFRFWKTINASDPKHYEYVTAKMKVIEL